MDQYGPSFLAIAATYVVWSIFRFMLTHCHRRNYDREIADALREINAKLQASQFEAVCLCYDCLKRSEGQRRNSIAAQIKIENDLPPPEVVAIGINDAIEETNS